MSQSQASAFNDRVKDVFIQYFLLTGDRYRCFFERCHEIF